MTPAPIFRLPSAGTDGIALLEGEKLLRRATIHDAIYWKGGALGLLGLFLLFKAFNLGVLFIVISGVALVLARLTQHYLLLALTDKRIVVRSGIVNLDTLQIHHSRIESIELARTILGRMFGYATVLISGTGSRIVAVPYVADAEAFRAELDKILFDRDEKR